MSRGFLSGNRQDWERVDRELVAEKECFLMSVVCIPKEEQHQQIVLSTLTVIKTASGRAQIFGVVLMCALKRRIRWLIIIPKLV